MKSVKERIEQTKELRQRVKAKREEVKVKIAQAAQAAAQPKVSTDWGTTGWNQTTYSAGKGYDPLDESFRRWEAEEELNELKRKMGS